MNSTNNKTQKGHRMNQTNILDIKNNWKEFQNSSQIKLIRKKLRIQQK